MNKDEKATTRAPRLHIVMPASRPDNVQKLIPHYLKNMEPHPWELRWHLMVQGPEPDGKGMNKVNEAIDMIRDGWVWTQSDDTYCPPRLFRRLWEVIEAHPEAGAIVFSQDRSGGTVLVAAPENVRGCHIDGSQLFWRRDFLGDNRFPVEHGGMADGVFITRMFAEHRERFVFVNEVLTVFGRLEWGDV